MILTQIKSGCIAVREASSHKSHTNDKIEYSDRTVRHNYLEEREKGSLDSRNHHQRFLNMLDAILLVVSLIYMLSIEYYGVVNNYIILI